MINNDRIAAYLIILAMLFVGALIRIELIAAFTLVLGFFLAQLNRVKQ